MIKPEIVILNSNEQEKFYEQILHMLIDADMEFCPPLSVRTSTTQSNLAKNQKYNKGVLNYFEELKKQRFVVACDGSKLLGFVSFRKNFVNSEIIDKDLPNIYISTLIVSADARGMGITYRMYENLFDTFNNVNVFTRTWSTNISHIKILSKFGFDIFKIIKGDRGEGIDTIYFKKGLK